jgi:prepilin-type N-terminal cleavage/methylation domain-containing protein
MRLLRRKGLTLMEMLMAMLVLSIITVAVSSVFMPVYMIYARANDLSEINTLLDNLSAVIMGDVEDATEVEAAPFKITFGGSPAAVYSIVDESDHPAAVGYLYRDDGVVEGKVLEPAFYKGKRVAIAHGEAGGLVTVTLTLYSNGTVMASRSYAARPLAMS